MLQKQPISITFQQGLETKIDSKQIPIGKFLALNNMVFDEVGKLKKRNGYPTITNLPNDLQTTLTTLNDNLIATGSNLYAFSQDTNQWLDQGTVQPIQLNTQTLVRASTSQSSPDTAVAPNGLTCLVYIDNSVAYYQISDSTTGQQIVPRTMLPATSVCPRTFVLGNNFIITFLETVGGTHLRYIRIPITIPTAPSTPADIATTVVSLSSGYDGVVVNNNLYLVWEAGGTLLQLRFMTNTFTLSPVRNVASSITARVGITADSSGITPNIWIAWAETTTGYAAMFDHNLNPVLAKTLIYSNIQAAEITAVAINGVCSVFYEALNQYPSPGFALTDYVNRVTVTNVGVVSSPTIILRSVGLTSKAFIDVSGIIYMMVAYGNTSGAINQPTYFLIDSLGNIYMRLAYSNGGGYEQTQVLANITLVDGVYNSPYLIKDFLASLNGAGANKGTGLPTGTPVNAIYTQTGVNLAKFSINTFGQHSSEIAGALHLTGGQLWEYDGVRPVEHGFQVYPENIAFTIVASGGGMTAQQYYYQFTYEWTDNAGNLQRSAPSIPTPVLITVSGSQVHLQVPTLRLTYKQSPNPVRIVGYRWSVAQQVYYQFTSLTAPTDNDTTVDYVTITDANSDSQILGNTILYTTGGVIENIAAPASIASTLFKNRLFLIDAEDQNLLWFSKQVIENTPVEMSDLLTLYVAPTSGAQGSTGPMTAIFPMDDKLIMFKRDAAYYLTGTGPDNTGGNNDFSDPVYITSSVGCSNPNSIVLMPSGLMFQSDKGIWLLARDLSTKYIGAPVEKYNSHIVKSATVIPGTNQVRFVLTNNVTLMYDYYTDTWGTFNNTAAISATLYQGKHTYLNIYGNVNQETPGSYLEGSQPVLLSLTTGWINVAGLQGYERFYFANLLGSYYTPFKLNVQFAYDYNPSPVQNVLVQPDNNSPAWGGEAQWGSGQAWGGPGNVFSARVFPEKQKCESFQLIMNEVYDPSLGVPAGQGLSLSGLNLVIGVKKGYRTQSAAKSFG